MRDRDTERRSCPGRHAAARIGALGLPLIALACQPASPGSMEIDQVVRDLLADPPEWVVEESHPEGEPHVDVLCPALKPGLDGADMVSLILSPPTQVSFTVGAGEAPASLRMRAGVDITTTRHFTPKVPEGRFRFEVLVNDEPAFDEEVILRDEPGRPGSEWIDVGGLQGLELQVGDRVTLRTSARDPAGNDVVPPGAVLAGFGGMRLERTVRRDRTRSSPEQPNLVVVVMDTLRADRLSAYGYERPTSPHLDELARGGTLFEHAYAASSWTWPSTASLLTGLLPEEHGVFDSASSFLGTNLDTLGEVLQAAGFTTAAWTGNPLVSASRNFDQGFEAFADDIHSFRWGQEFFPEVERWIAEQAGTRFFLYLHFIEPHRPYRPLAEGWELLAADVPATVTETGQSVAERLDRGRGLDEQGRSLLDEVTTAEERRQVERIYDACVWSGDHWLGRVVAALEAAGLEEETVVVFTSDHGEELFERSFLGHSMSVYSELVRVPLVIRGPGVPVGRRIATPLSNRHVASLCASLGGVELGGVELGAGLDAEQLLREREAPVFYSTAKGFWRGEHNTTVRGMRLGSLALQVAQVPGSWPEPEHDPRLRLFDLASDPGEMRDLAGERPEEARRLEALLERHHEGLVPRFEAQDYRAGVGTTMLLERIGYGGR